MADAGQNENGHTNYLLHSHSCSHRAVPLNVDTSTLQWRVISPIDELKPRPSPIRASSWSRAGIDNEVVFQQDDVIIEGFEIMDARVSQGFGTSASGSIMIRGPVLKGPLWWDATGHIRMDSLNAGLEIMEQDDSKTAMTVWPDCIGELLNIVDGAPLVAGMELDLVAIGRAHSDPGVVRGLVLKREDFGKTHYTRLAMFQVRDRGPFSIQDWDNETMTIF